MSPAPSDTGDEGDVQVFDVRTRLWARLHGAGDGLLEHLVEVFVRRLLLELVQQDNRFLELDPMESLFEELRCGKVEPWASPTAVALTAGKELRFFQGLHSMRLLRTER